MPTIGAMPTPPPPWLKRLYAVPQGLYRIGLGRLLGHRFLLLTHTGRSTGARYRAVVDNLIFPAAELTQLGMLQMQRSPQIGTLYSQSAGLTHFLIHYDSGRYRDALVAYLVAVYTGRARPDTLSQLIGASFDELDQQYREYLAALPDSEAPMPETAGE